MISDKIAIFMKDTCEAASCGMADTIAVFEKTDGEWVRNETLYVNSMERSGIPEIRSEIRRIAEALGACRIAAGTQISGIMYQELDKLGFSIFEITQCSPAVLDEILKDVTELNASAGTPEEAPGKPAETETPGVFFFDLQRLQNAHPEISSKQALRDFLENEPFYELRLVCAHLPPWLENGGYDINTEPMADGQTLAVLRKKQCGGI